MRNNFDWKSCAHLCNNNKIPCKIPLTVLNFMTMAVREDDKIMHFVEWTHNALAIFVSFNFINSFPSPLPLCLSYSACYVKRSIFDRSPFIIYTVFLHRQWPNAPNNSIQSIIHWIFILLTAHECTVLNHFCYGRST